MDAPAVNGFPKSFRLILAFVVAWLAPSQASAHPQEAEALPPPPVRLRVIAPSAKGAWLLRIDNVGDEPVRIAADVRLLSFEVRTRQSKKLPLRISHRHGWARRATRCNGPSDFGIKGHFPAGRELVLEPGHSYVEEFDPRLICFDDDAELLVPGALVKPYYGWPPNKRWRKMSAAPFVADAAKEPRKFKPLRRLEAPTMLLSHDEPVEYGPAAGRRGKGGGADGKGAEAEGAGKGPSGASASKGATKGPTGSEDGGDASAEEASEPPEPKSAEEASRYRPRVPKRKRPPPPKDELNAAMTLTTDDYADALRPTDVQVNVQAHNVGQRPVFVALRARMLSFKVVGPNGVVVCPRASQNHKVPRDLFRTLHHDKHIHMAVLLAEVCPPGTFDRPGLYAAIPTLHADADGSEYGLKGMTGKVTVRDPGNPSGTHEATDDAMLVRIRRGSKPFYVKSPKALPTRVLPK